MSYKLSAPKVNPKVLAKDNNLNKQAYQFWIYGICNLPMHYELCSIV